MKVLSTQQTDPTSSTIHFHSLFQIGLAELLVETCIMCVCSLFLILSGFIQPCWWEQCDHWWDKDKTLDGKRPISLDYVEEHFNFRKLCHHFKFSDRSHFPLSFRKLLLLWVTSPLHLHFSRALCREGKAKAWHGKYEPAESSLCLSHSVNGISSALSIKEGGLAIDQCRSPLMSAGQKPIYNPPSPIGRQLVREDEALAELRQMEWRGERERERSQTQRGASGEKGLERKEEKSSALRLQLRCFHPSDLIRSKTNQCSQLGCFDWQQLHRPQMETELQFYLFIHTCLCWCVCVCVSSCIHIILCNNLVSIILKSIQSPVQAWE